MNNFLLSRYACSLLFLFCTLESAAQSPIPADSDVFTMTDWREAIQAHQIMEFKRAYEGGPHQGEEWDHLIPDLMRKCTLVFTGAPNAPEWSDWAVSAQAVLDLGCDDPMVHYARAYAAEELDEPWHIVHTHATKAIDSFASSGYPPLYRAFAASRYAQRFDGEEHSRRFYEIVAQSLLAHARELPDSWIQRRYFVLQSFIQLDHLPSDLAEEWIDDLVRTEALDDCTKLTLLGYLQFKLGWKERGAGFAHEVEPRGWKGFAHHLRNASEYLVRAYELDPSRPEAATPMISIASAGLAPDGDTPRLWFDRAVAAHLDMPDAYNRYINSLRPRWGGSHEAMIAFARECVATKRFDTAIAEQVVTIFRHLLTDARGDHSVLRQYDLYALAKAALEPLAESPSQAARIDYFRTWQLVVAWACEEYDDAISLFNSLDGKEVPMAWQRLYANAREVSDDVIAFSSELSEHMIAAASSMRANKPQIAAEHLEQAVLAGSADPRLMRVIRDRLVTAQNYSSFLSGQSVPLQFGNELEGWRVIYGNWRRSGRLTIRANPDVDGALLLNRMPIGSRWELRGTLNLRALSNKNDQICAGFFFRQSDLEYQDDWYCVFVFPHTNRVTIGYRYHDPMTEEIEIEAQPERLFRFVLQLWDDHAVLKINDKQVFSGRLRHGSRANLGDYLALGTRTPFRTSPMTYSRLEIRKLEEKPAALP